MIRYLDKEKQKYIINVPNKANVTIKVLIYGGE